MNDASANIAVYITLGAGAFLLLARRYSPKVAAAAGIFIGLFLSLAMEVLQAYVLGRTSSLFDLACNVTGTSAGVIAAWIFRRKGSRFRSYAAPPVLLLACWVCYHLYPFVPAFSLARMPGELMLWLHPQSVSVIETWSFAAEWLAAGIAVKRLFGPLRLWWLLAALAFHFAVRPFVAARPLMLEELWGLIVALLLWKTLSPRARSSPWFLISVVVLREWVPTPWSSLSSAFWWFPFKMLFASTRLVAILFLSRAMFDYGAILWLWFNRGMSYIKAGAILASTLAVLALMQRYLPGGALSMTDPALVLLLALIFRTSSVAPFQQDADVVPNKPMPVQFPGAVQAVKGARTSV